mgnify:CR=1 FL=1
MYISITKRFIYNYNRPLLGFLKKEVVDAIGNNTELRETQSRSFFG